MKQKHFLLFALFLFLGNLHAQVSLQFNSVNEYIFNTREALNFSLINSNLKSFEVQFKGKITKSDGSTVVEFKAGPANVNPGANLFTPMTLALTDVQYFNSDIAEIEAKTGTYPSGTYRICIWTECAQPDCNGAGQNAGSIEMPVCIQVNVENPTPLVLAFPTDKSEIEETRPTYTWIPPAPIAGIGGLNYTMTLVEMMDGQSKSDALAMNRPIIDMQGINASTMMHPTDFPELEAGKTYAWQVQAYVGNTFVAKSEQWQFKVKKPKEVKDSIKLVLIAHSIPGTEIYIVRTDSFKFKYAEQYSFLDGENLKFNITDESNAIIRSFTNSDGLYIVQGVNDYKLDISFNGLWLKNGVYMLIIQNAKKEKYYLRFKVDK